MASTPYQNFNCIMKQKEFDINNSKNSIQSLKVDLVLFTKSEREKKTGSYFAAKVMIQTISFDFFF